METFECIEVPNAWQAMQQGARLVDIRDPQSFEAAHIKGAFHLTNGSLNQFVSESDFEQPVLVLCYHGVSSQGAAQYLINQGFETVYSVNGGFEAWRKLHPEHVISQSQ